VLTEPEGKLQSGQEEGEKEDTAGEEDWEGYIVWNGISNLRDDK